jgi:hypothetical protein
VNTRLKYSLCLTLIAAGPAIWADPPKAAPAKPAPARSVFVMPASASEGRDPFFPESNRPYEDSVASKRTSDATAFTVKGMSFEHGRPMVIINNHTFAIGDEGDVLTANGRTHIRLINIRNSTVTIEVNGTRRELTVGLK